MDAVEQLSFAARQEHTSRFDIELRAAWLRETALGQMFGDSWFELKSDRRWARTGNHFLEVTQNGGRPSGIAASRANWWVVEYGPECRLILPISVVRAMWRFAEARGRVLTPGGDNDNKGYLIPLGWFTERNVLLTAVAEAAR